MSKTISHKLTDGPIFKPSFVPWKWIAFEDDNGKNCFESHTFVQIVTVARNHISTERNIAYAEILQNGTWD